MKSIRLFPVALVAILVVSSCKTGVPDNFDYGVVSDGKYTNSFFNMELTIPKDWAVQSKKELEDLAKDGEKIVSGDNEKLRKSINASKVNVANLLAVYQFKVGTTNDYNPSLMLTVENLNSHPQITSAKLYLNATRDFINKSEFKYDRMDSIYTKRTIGGKEFDTMHCDLTYNGFEIQQDYRATLINGFSFVIITSYSTPDQKLLIEDFLNTLRFN